MSDITYQKTKWGKETGVHWGGVYSNIEFFLNEEELHKTSQQAVGLYLFKDEVDPINTFSKAFSHSIERLNNIYDSKEAMESEAWPHVIHFAQIAPKHILANDRTLHITYD